jgi:hypothetical protein
MSSCVVRRFARNLPEGTTRKKKCVSGIIAMAECRPSITVSSVVPDRSHPTTKKGRRCGEWGGWPRVRLFSDATNAPFFANMLHFATANSTSMRRDFHHFHSKSYFFLKQQTRRSWP